MSRAVAFLKLIRAPMAFTAMADSLAGAIVGGGPLEAGPIAGVMLISACLYSMGMALNDVVDVRRDRDLHPERPLVTGAISWWIGLGTSLAFGAAAVAIAAYVGPALKVTLALAGAVLVYDCFAKHLSVIGAVNMGACRALNVAVGLSLSPDFSLGIPFLFIAFSYVLLVTCVSLLEESPRLPPYAGLMALLAIVPLGTAIAGSDPIGRWAGALVSIALAIRLCRLRADVESIGGSIGLGLRLIIVLDAGYAASMGHWLGAAAVLALLPAAWASGRALKVLS